MWDGIVNHKVEDEYSKKRRNLYECHTRKVTPEELEKIISERGKDMGKRGPKPGFKRDKRVNEAELVDQQTIKATKEEKALNHVVEDLGTIRTLQDIHTLNHKPADWSNPAPKAEVNAEPAETKTEAPVLTTKIMPNVSVEIKDVELIKDYSPAKKPPMGIMPKWRHDEMRLGSIIGAIERYIDAKCQVPLEWIEEYNQLVKEVK